MSTPDQLPPTPQELPECPPEVRDYMQTTTEGLLSRLPDSQRGPILNARCIVAAACRVGVLRDAANTATEMQRDQEGVWARMPSPDACRELRALLPSPDEIGRPICMLEVALRDKGLL